MKVRDVIRILEKDGWVLNRIRGSHRQFIHPTKPGITTVAGKPSVDLKTGILHNIFKQAQIDWRKRT